jgi:transcriptional regulator with XRE-family HTH domain
MRAGYPGGVAISPLSEGGFGTPLCYAPRVTNAVTPSQVFGRRVKEERDRLGLTQQELVDRLATRGLPMDRSTLVKLERGRSASPPLDKVFVLAAALEVPPVVLLSPRAEDEPVAVTPNTVVPAWYARAWMSGPAPLPGGGINWGALPKDVLRPLVKAALEDQIRRMPTRSPLERSLMRGKLDEQVELYVERMFNPKEEHDAP